MFKGPEGERVPGDVKGLFKKNKKRTSMSGAQNRRE